MPEAIMYCDECGRMIPPREMSRGEAIITPTMTVCSACAGKLTPEQRSALLGLSDRPAHGQTRGPAPSPSRRVKKRRRTTSTLSAQQPPPQPSTSRRRTTTAVSRQAGPVDLPEFEPEPEKPKTARYVMIGLVCLGMVAGAAFMMMPRKGEDDDKASSGGVPPVADLADTGPAQAGGERKAAAAAARKAHLDRIRRLAGKFMAGSSSSGYRDIQKEFASFQESFPQDEEAGALQAQVDEAHGKLADKALANAGELARRLATSGFKDQAVSRIRSVAERFGESPWYDTRGREAVEKALSEIEPGAAAAAVSEDPGEVTRRERGPRTTASSTNAVTNSAFEILDEKGRPVDWPLPTGATFLFEDGNHFVRLEQKRNARVSVFLTGRFKLDPKWKTIHVSCRLRTRALRPGGRAVDGASCVISFEGANRKRLKVAVESSLSLKKSSDWVQLDGKATVPEGAEYVVLKPGLYRSLGTLDVDDISVGPGRARRLAARRSAAVEGARGARGGTPRASEGPSGETDLRRAHAALRRGDFAGARAALSGRQTWRESDLSRADDLLEQIDEAEAAEALRARSLQDPYTKLLMKIREAVQKGGISEAKAVFRRERAGLPAEYSERADYFSKRISAADLVEALVVDGLAALKRPVRLNDVSGNRIAGRVQSVEDGLIRIKSTVGKLKEVRLVDVPPEELVRATRLLRHGAVTKFQLASFAFVLGDMDATGKWVADADGEGVKALYDDIKLLKVALPPEPPADVEEGTGERAAEGGADPAGREVTRPTGPAADIAGRGLIGYWKLDDTGDTVTDSSGNGNHATRHDGKWTTGKIGGAFNCAGGGYIEMPHSPDLDKVQKGDYSISCWFRPVEYSKGLGSVFGKNGMHMGIVSHTEARLAMWHWLRGGEKKFVAPNDNVKKAKGVWYHVVGVVDQAAAEARLYVDGRPAAKDGWGKGYVTAPYGGTWKIGCARPPDAEGPQLAGDCDVDDVRIYDRVLSGGEVAWLANPDTELAAGGRAAPAGGAVGVDLFERMDAYFANVPKGGITGVQLSRGVVINLARRYDGSRVSAKKLSAVGGAVAANTLFNASLKKQLTKGAGYRFASTSGVAGRGKTIGAVRKSIGKYLDREKPEFVRVCFDATDLAKGRSVKDLESELAEITKVILDHGALPVLFTLPILPPTDAEGRKTITSYNDMVTSLATRLNVPCVNAWVILNADLESRRKNFRGAGALTRSGYGRVNSVVFFVYRVLEHLVAGRDVPLPLAAGGRDGGRPGSVLGAEDPPPAGNLIVNGGFEQVADGMPKGWRKHNWGVGQYRGEALVRSDSTELHSGKRSLQIRGLGRGALAGAFTTVTLPKGTYEVRFWATTEVDETVAVRVRHGDTILAPSIVTDEWSERKERFTVFKKETNVSFGLFVATIGKRLWIDDVELEYVGM